MCNLLDEYQKIPLLSNHRSDLDKNVAYFCNGFLHNYEKLHDQSCQLFNFTTILNIKIVAQMWQFEKLISNTHKSPILFWLKLLPLLTTSTTFEDVKLSLRQNLVVCVYHYMTRRHKLSLHQSSTMSECLTASTYLWLFLFKFMRS